MVGDVTGDQRHIRWGRQAIQVCHHLLGTLRVPFASVHMHVADVRQDGHDHSLLAFTSEGWRLRSHFSTWAACRSGVDTG